jgi:PDZ domain-containing protein
VSRRALTLLLAGVLSLALTLAAAVTRVPYVSLGPGPAYDTLGAVNGSSVISVTGAKTYPTNGRLDLTTVGVQDGITLFDAVRGWLSPREEVVPREVLFPPEQTAKQVDQMNVQEMKQSQDAATAAALRQLGLPTTTVVAVESVATGAPATGKLTPGDILTTVDGSPVDSATRLRQLVGAHKPGDQVTVGYSRRDRPATATITTTSSSTKPPRSILGVGVQEQSSSPIKVTISLRDVGGPSAGLMFALGIIDKLGPDSLTGGRNIAGTGEIRPDGTVGQIGGIAEKLLGARAVGATVFLVPADNCADAKANRPSGLELVKVATLKQALAALQVLGNGGTPAPC